MKKWLLIMCSVLAFSVQAKTPVDAPVIKVLFAPQDNVQAAIVQALNGARQQVWVQAYLLTDNKISDALIAANKRGVKVNVLLDAERARQASGSDAQRLTDAGIKVRLETRYENAHNKVMIIDNQTVITGSYNFTYSAQFKNAENILFIKNAPQLIQSYRNNWQAHDMTATDFK